MPVKPSRDYIDRMAEKVARDIEKLDKRHSVGSDFNKLGKTWDQGTGGKSPEQLERMLRRKG
jgi:hypothetical protein